MFSPTSHEPGFFLNPLDYEVSWPLGVDGPFRLRGVNDLLPETNRTIPRIVYRCRTRAFVPQPPWLARGTRSADEPGLW